MKKSQISLSTGQSIDVWTVTGTVADDQQSSSTRVYSKGGGGYVGPNGGHVAAPEIQSVTTTRQVVWITDADKKDHELTMTNTQIPLRVGQHVTARFVLPIGEAQQRLETFTNHTADQFYTWTDKFDPPANLMATDHRSVSATSLVVGGCIATLYSVRQVSRAVTNDMTFIWVVLVLLSALAVFTGAVLRHARRSKLRSKLHEEYVAAFHSLG